MCFGPLACVLAGEGGLFFFFLLGFVCLGCAGDGFRVGVVGFLLGRMTRNSGGGVKARPAPNIPTLMVWIHSNEDK